MDEQQFRDLLHKMIDRYGLDPETAEELLQRILKRLSNDSPGDIPACFHN